MNEVLFEILWAHHVLCVDRLFWQTAHQQIPKRVTPGQPHVALLPSAQVFYDDVVHFSDEIDAVKDTGKSLCEVQPQLGPSVGRTADNIDQRYNDLHGQIGERLSSLQAALGRSRSVQDSLDGLLRWLDKAEKEAHVQDKGTVIKVEREPLQECAQNCKVSALRNE